MRTWERPQLILGHSRALTGESTYVGGLRFVGGVWNGVRLFLSNIWSICQTAASTYATDIDVLYTDANTVGEAKFEAFTQALTDATALDGASGGGGDRAYWAGVLDEYLWYVKNGTDSYDRSEEQRLRRELDARLVGADDVFAAANAGDPIAGIGNSVLGDWGNPYSPEFGATMLGTVTGLDIGPSFYGEFGLPTQVSFDNTIDFAAHSQYCIEESQMLKDIARATIDAI